MTPEAKARQQIDEKLTRAGWAVQDMKQLNLGAAVGVAVREYPTDSGPADYALFVNREAVGVIEATCESSWAATTQRTATSAKRQIDSSTIGFAASSIGGQIGSAPAPGAADVAAKAVASGTVPGVASEALGGKFEDGFVAGAATSLAHDYYAHYTGKKPDPRPADKGAIAKVGKEAAKVPGSRVVDSDDAMRNLDPRINHIIGKFTATPGQSGWAYEGSSFMRAVNKVPGMNTMAYFHDIWAIDANLGAVMNPVTIVPATVLTYTALGANQDAQRLKTSTKDDDHE